MRYLPFALITLAAIGTAVLSGVSSELWLLAAIPLIGLALIGLRDLLQRDHSLLRNYPVIGHGRYLLETIRPEMQQYFIERDTDGRPFNRNDRGSIYERAKGMHDEEPYGTEYDLYAAGTEWIAHSLGALTKPDGPQPRITVGGPQCSKPYEMALLNTSAMSFGSLSANAIRALNLGAKIGGYAHDTGEGGLSPYHLENGGDLVWEIGSGYFGCRNEDGRFDPGLFEEKAAHEQVRVINIKLSQGAKPGLGGVMPAAKVTREIAEIRGVPVGEKCVSPPVHSAFDGPIGLMEFVAELRERSGGKPTGFKLCVGTRVELLGICKAMLETEILPDFIVVDGSEGGTGAAPLEFMDHVGTPLTEGLMTVHNALVGTGQRDRIRVGASGKVANSFDIARRMAIGADYTNSARAMMMAVGCLQTQRCHTNDCPVGVATQDPARTRALVVADKGPRAASFQAETVDGLMSIVFAAGLDHPRQLGPDLLLRRVGQTHVVPYTKLYEWLRPGELLEGPRDDWAADWAAATTDRFARRR